MNQTSTPRIAFSEWLPTGIMVHFESGESVLYSSQFLYEQKETPPNTIFASDGSRIGDAESNHTYP